MLSLLRTAFSAAELPCGEAAAEDGLHHRDGYEASVGETLTQVYTEEPEAGDRFCSCSSNEQSEQKPTMLIFTKEWGGVQQCYACYKIIATSAHLPTAHPGLKNINHMDFSAYLLNRPRNPCSLNHMI